MIASGALLGALLTAVGGKSAVGFVRKGMDDPGGLLGYTTRKFPNLYFTVFKAKNELMVKTGLSTPLHEISSNPQGALYIISENGRKITGPDGKVFHLQEGAKQAEIFLGILPSSYVLGELKKKLGTKLDSKELFVISPVESHEYRHLAPELRDTNTSSGEAIAHQVDTVDNAPVRISEIKEGVDYIERGAELDKIELVHCKSGVGRSATLVAAYYMKNYKMSAHEAAAFVKERRPEVVIDKEGHYHRKALEDYDVYLAVKRGEDVEKLLDLYKIRGDADRVKKIKDNLSESEKNLIF